MFRLTYYFIIKQIVLYYLFKLNEEINIIVVDLNRFTNFSYTYLRSLTTVTTRTIYYIIINHKINIAEDFMIIKRKKKVRTRLR